LKSLLSKDGVTRLIKEVGKRDFTVYKEFLKKVNIFQKQSNEKPFKYLIDEEIRTLVKHHHQLQIPCTQSLQKDFLSALKKFGMLRLIYAFCAVPLPCRSAKALDCVFPI
jgi:hypothetical protein